MNNSSEGGIEPRHSTRVAEQDIKSDADLLLCCDTAPRLRVRLDDADVTCLQCGCSVHTYDREVKTSTCKAEAIATWDRHHTRAHTPAVGDAQQARELVGQWDETLHSPTDHDDARNNLIDRITTALQAAAAERDDELATAERTIELLRGEVREMHAREKVIASAAASAREAERERIRIEIETLPCDDYGGNDGFVVRLRDVRAAVAADPQSTEQEKQNHAK